jgi:hypothetical protein
VEEIADLKAQVEAEKNRNRVADQDTEKLKTERAEELECVRQNQ